MSEPILDIVSLAKNNGARSQFQLPSAATDKEVTTLHGTVSPAGKLLTTAATEEQMSNGNNNQEHVANYGGPERRRIPYRMEVEPSTGWWGKVTLPFILAIVLQAGGIVWWASSISGELLAIQTSFKSHQQHNLEKERELLALIQDVRSEIRDNRRLIVGHLQDVAAAERRFGNGSN